MSIPIRRGVLQTSTCSGFHTNTPQVDVSRALEEETLPYYEADQYYPVRIGELLGSKYRVIGKLGYGAHSTAWLCRNTLNSPEFVTVKVCTRDHARDDHADRELRLYEHLSSIDSEHPGQMYIRFLLDEFTITGRTGEHLCLVQPPMQMTMQQLRYMNPSRRFTKDLMNSTLFHLLTALAYLHDVAGVVHTDIKPSNVMLSILDESVFTEFEKAELEDPSPAKKVDAVRTIYASREFEMPKAGLWGHPVLCDFGAARIGPHHHHKGIIQPELYRAPEVLFDMEWGTSADMWSVALFTWDLFENRHLFNAEDENGGTDPNRHLAEMIAYLGPPPLDYLRRSDLSEKVFDAQGQWKRVGGLEIPPLSLEQAEVASEGEEKEHFLEFMRTMLKWKPEERITAAKLLEHPWMMQQESGP